MLGLCRFPCTVPKSSPLYTPGHFRAVSNSPYGRTHVWKRRPPVLPNPIVPKYPQLVIRSDGTTFTQWTTSPRSVIRLTRDTTNNPVWNTGTWSSDRSAEEEETMAGRLGRFGRRFEELGKEIDDQKWMEEMASTTSSYLPELKEPVAKKPSKKK